MDFDDWWAVLRSRTPAFLEEFPDCIIKHAVGPYRSSSHPYVLRGLIAVVAVGCYPRQYLGSLYET